jgi:hypothetical protein
MAPPRRTPKTAAAAAAEGAKPVETVDLAATPAEAVVVAASTAVSTDAATAVSTDAAVVSTDAAVVSTDAAADAVESAHRASRMQISSVLKINISQARCATHLKQNIGDAEVEREVKALRTSLKAAKAAGAGEAELNAIKEQITQKSLSVLRMSQQSPIATASIWDVIVDELLKFGMDRAIEDGKTTVDVSHIRGVNRLKDHKEGDKLVPTHPAKKASDLVYYPIYHKCPAWANYDQAAEEELAKRHSLAAKAAKAVKAEGTAAALPAAPGDEGDAAPGSKRTFFTYVENSIKAIRQDTRPDNVYSPIRVSHRVREFVAEIIAEGFARITQTVNVLVKQLMGVRTMGAIHVKTALRIYMLDEGRSVEQCDQIDAIIDAKLAAHSSFVTEERGKKVVALSEDKKTALADKAAARKVERLAKIKQQVRDLAAHAKSLEAEIAA